MEKFSEIQTVYCSQCTTAGIQGEFINLDTFYVCSACRAFAFKELKEKFKPNSAECNNGDNEFFD